MPLFGGIRSSVAGSQPTWRHHDVPTSIRIPDLNVHTLLPVALLRSKGRFRHSERKVLRAHLNVLGVLGVLEALLLHILLFKF